MIGQLNPIPPGLVTIVATLFWGAVRSRVKNGLDVNLF